jgi:hypothetical protein
MTQHHDPARFFALLTGSQEERDAADTIVLHELENSGRETLFLLKNGTVVDYDYSVVLFRAVARLEIIATLDLRALLEEREALIRDLKASNDICEIADGTMAVAVGTIDRLERENAALSTQVAIAKELGRAYADKAKEAGLMRMALETILIQTDVRHTTYDFRIDAKRNFKALEFIENTARAALNPKAQELGT